MNCPVCSETLKMSERQGVEIDFCPKCRGVWLDRGELDKILERAGVELTQQQAAVSSREPRLRYERESDDYYRPGKKRKSLWHELFD
jgi:Zn-finger nucleic acid-binding protein